MKQTPKTIEAEKWVDKFILDNNKPPTYDEISKGLNISKTASFHRCRFIRDKININFKTKVIREIGSFSFALKQIMLGKQMKRRATKNDTIICLYKQKLVQMSKLTGVRYLYTPSNEDLLSLDWEIVD